ncbi:MAG: polyprenyl synthetase family protein [Gammaproteobacteria bacterium]|nr:MAG: dimethylallyltransferase [Gammaproteobacteria bacterium TMED226]
MKKNKKFIKELKQVEALIKKDLSKEKTISGLYKYIFKSNGKKIRANLSLIASSKKINKNRIKLASVIELLHTATLVHDDVVDNSPLRRGVKSVNNIWTNSHGVLIGDYIYSKAFMYMVDIGNEKILRELANATNDISQGELIQLDAVKNLDITLNKLKKISYFKTGRLFEASAKTGAINANANKAFISNISECAKYLGILFQIKDDLLDYSEKSRIGKPIFQDLKEGKVTYPFFYAYRNANVKEKKQLQNLLGSTKKIKKEDIILINKLGGILKTNQLALDYHKKSFEYANKIKDLRIKEEMIELANTALNREK